MESVTVRAAGRESTATAAAAPRRACQRTARCAAVGAGVSVAAVCALYREHPGTSVRSALHAATSAPLQGKSSLLQEVQYSRAFFYVMFTTVLVVFPPGRQKMFVSLRYTIRLFF